MINLPAEQRLKHWYICFSDARTAMPFQKYLKPGFRHVNAFAYDEEADVWIFFNPGWDGIVIRAVRDPGKLIARSYINGPVLYCEIEGNPIWKPRVLMVCTSQICHLLGIDLFVHTPWRLFCALKKLGASDLIFEDK